MQKSLPIVSFYNFEERAFAALASLLVLSAGLYIYFISATVLSIVERTNAIAETKVLDTKISELESEYMTFGSGIGLSEAKLLGYQEIAKIDYVSRTTSLGFAR